METGQLAQEPRLPGVRMTQHTDTADAPQDDLQDEPQDEPFASLEIGGTRIDILGTAHVSEVSRRRVRELLLGGEYDAVAVELCESRRGMLINPDAIAEMDLSQVIRERKAAAIAALLILGGYQRRLAERFGIEPGAEMKEALVLSQERSLGLYVIDREIGLTLKRLYHRVPWWRRAMLLSGMLASLVYTDDISEQDIEELKHSASIETAFEQLPFSGAAVQAVLVNERDAYMAAKIRALVAEKKPASLLVVIGAGHLPGLLRELERSERPNAAVIAELERAPKRGRWVRYLPWIVVGVILAGFAAGFSHGVEFGAELVFSWVLINGGLAGLGALIAAAHPLTIISVFFAAPLTSINPTIGAGMVAAAVELWLRKPRVSDFHNLRDDTTRFSGWRRNRAAKVLLIFILSTLGSALGTYLGGFHIYDRLTGS